jgi:hypothetical protein
MGHRCRTLPDSPRRCAFLPAFVVPKTWHPVVVQGRRMETWGGRSRVSSRRSEVHRVGICSVTGAERIAKSGGSRSLERAAGMRSVHCFFRQELRSDIGVAAVATLLWTPGQGNTSIDSAKGPEGSFEEVGGGERWGR